LKENFNIQKAKHVSTHPLTGEKLYFEEEKHIYAYIDKNNETHILASVSAFISQYMPKFDTVGMATRVASKKGIDVNTVIAEWEKKRNDACTFGTKIHAHQEAMLKNESAEFDFVGEREIKIAEAGKQAIKDIYKKEWWLYQCELPVFSSQYKIAGTIDVIFKRGNEWMIADWKTNEKIDTRNFYGGKALNPISHLDDCSFVKYSIQLNLYERLLRNAGYISDKEKVRKTIFHLKEKEYEAIIVPELTEIDDLINDFNSKSFNNHDSNYLLF